MEARVVSPDLKTELDLIDSQSAKLRMTRLQVRPLATPLATRLHARLRRFEAGKLTSRVRR